MGQGYKQLHVHIVQTGRPLGRFPLFIFRDGNRFLLTLIGIDVSDVGNSLAVEPIYKPFLEVIPGGVTCLIFRTRKTFIVYLTKYRITFQTEKDDKEPEV